MWVVWLSALAAISLADSALPSDLPPPKHISQDVHAWLGLPYARAPLRQHRFTNAVPTTVLTATATEWQTRCINPKGTEGTGEDCLYLSFIQHAKTRQNNKPVNALLFITNDELSEAKLADLVSSQLNIIVAHAREGFLGYLGSSSFAQSDVEAIVQFLQHYKQSLLLADITVYAENGLAEVVAEAINGGLDVSRSILHHGHSLTRTLARENTVVQQAEYRMLKFTGCDLPSHDQALDCLRSLSLEQLQEAEEKIKAWFRPFGSPFRAVSSGIPGRTVPSLITLYKEAPAEQGYNKFEDFTVAYSYADNFKKFMARMIPDSKYTNGPLLRRLALHDYIYTKGDKHDIYNLFQNENIMLLDRDFHVPTHNLVHAIKDKTNTWLLQYGIDNPSRSCYQDEQWEDQQPFCDRLIAYHTRFATLGAPTQEGCNPENPSWHPIGKSKRDYFFNLMSDGRPRIEFNWHQAACELWNNLLPTMSKLELAGRRDAVFKEETEPDAWEEEDDVQGWHSEAASRWEADQASGKTTLTDEELARDEL